jgi:SAM-dependent methyltransferase
MNNITDPAAYEAWYHSPRGRWIGDREFDLLQGLLKTGRGDTLLDVGCGTGHFSRRFARRGLSVTGMDSDSGALEFARSGGNGVRYVEGDARDLPFPDTVFDYTIAVTSLGFIEDPAKALRILPRTSRSGLVHIASRDRTSGMGAGGRRLKSSRHGNLFIYKAAACKTFL